LHLGQRKLLLSEVEFLTIYGHLATDVLYVGSAPGHHIEMIVRLFPNHKFTLYDPRDFAVRAGPRVTLHQQYFTDDDAKKWVGRPHLLISDIRNADTYVRGKADSNDEHDGEVMNDMNMQQSWVQIAKPLMAILKFRLSWKLDKQDYLDGEVRFQPWAYKTSTETRLITDGKNMRTWDPRKYERQMYRFNTITRIAHYDIDKDIVDHVKGMDYCYDCAAEVDIWKAYAVSPYGGKYSKAQPGDIVKLINEATKYTNGKGLDQDKHGLHKDIKDIHKREVAICTQDKGTSKKGKYGKEDK
jgi:cap2 methyltransferase